MNTQRPFSMLALASGFLFPLSVSWAAPPLPPADAVQRGVDSAPAMQIARARLAEAQHAATLDALGPYDWTVSGASARRRVDGEGSYQEWDTALERTVRLPGKAQLDRKIGQLRVQQATAELLLARRSSLAAILDAWFICLDARERVRLLEQDLQVLQTMADSVARRRRAGDLAELDEALAAGELAAVRAEVIARRIDTLSTSRLLATWLEAPSCDLGSWDAPPQRADAPASAPAAQRALSDPGVIAGQAAADRAAATATRVRRERWPDPTVGVTYGRERDGAERVGGLTISIPLGVRRRLADAARAGAASTAAAAELEATRHEVERRWIQIDADARRAYQAWSALAEAESQQRRAANLSQRAFELGEASLAEALIARRTALQAALVERAAALESWHAQAIYDSFVVTHGPG